MNRTPGNLHVYAWFYVLTVSVLLSGLVGLVGNLWPQLSLPANLTIPVGQAVALLLAGSVMLVLMARSQLRRRAMAKGDCKAAIYGGLGVVCTFALLILASWGIHQERQRSASAIVNHHAVMLDHELQNAAGLMGRLSDRWSSLGLNVPESLKQSELTRYFNDIPALKSLLVIAKDRQVMLHESKHEDIHAWLRNHMRDPEVLQWIYASMEEQRYASWVMPDLARPHLAILLILPSGPDQEMFFSAFDFKVMLHHLFELVDHELTITVTPEYEAALQLADPADERQYEIHQETTVSIPAGPAITIRATGGPVSLFRLPGIVVPCIFFFGLFVSYLLAVGQSVSVLQRQKSRELSIEEQRFRSLFFQSPDAVFEFAKDGRYMSANAHAKAFTGITDEDLEKVHYRDVLNEERASRKDLEAFDAAFRKAVAGDAQVIRSTYLSVAGERRDYESSLVPVLVDGKVVGVYSVVKDVTERFLAHENQRLLTKSLESSDSGVLVVDVRSKTMPAVFINSAFTELTGYSREQIFNSSLASITHWIEESEDAELIKSTIERGEARSFTIKSYRQDGTPFWNQLSLAPVKDDDGVVTHYTAIMKDVSEKRQHEKQMAYQATHDVLTGLANRSLLEDRLEHDIALAKRNGEMLAVLFIDLDAFKPINDTLGHRIGDEVLISVARRMQSVIRPTDTLARFGGDEFVLLLPNLESVHEAERVAERILREVGQPHRVEGHELYVTASIGVSFMTEDLDRPSKLLQQGDMAMYKAKQQGRDTYVAYSEDLDEKLSKRVMLRNELQEGIRNNQLFLHYQPQVDDEGRYCGLEALVRWEHPTKGMISPAEFIPIAEETAQIIHLGQWVMAQACSDAQQLLQRGMLRGRMAVNLSPLQFHRTGFLGVLNEVLERTGLPPTCLEFEVTEGVVMRRNEASIDLLHDMKIKGITTAIDDFGTGYSSFSYLRDLPVESVKIDKSFVDSVLSDQRDAAVCKGVIAMAKEMGMKVVAEGVETREQFERLTSYGCEAFQGFYFARPMSFADLRVWIEHNLASQDATVSNTRTQEVG